VQPIKGATEHYPEKIMCKNPNPKPYPFKIRDLPLILSLTFGTFSNWDFFGSLIAFSSIV